MKNMWLSPRLSPKGITRSVGLIVLTAFLFGKANAQSETENKIWSGIKLNHKFTKWFSVGFENQFRYNLESAEGSHFTEIETDFKVSKIVSLSHDLRIYTIDPGVRSAINLGLRKNLNDVRLRYRARFTNAFDQEGFDDSFLRHKIGLGYNLSKWVDPEIDIEWFSKRSNGTLTYDAYRAGVSLDFRLTKKMDLSTFVKQEKEVSDGDTSFIYGFKLAIDL